MHQNMHQALQRRRMEGIPQKAIRANLFDLDGLSWCREGVEPPRAEARRILSFPRIP
jgi:hypothetical protein